MSVLTMTNLEVIRKRKGFAKRVSLAAAANVSERSIANFEDGHDRPVSKKVRGKLAAALGVPEWRLFDEAGCLR